MKPKSSLLTVLAIAVGSLLAVTSASAEVLYWDGGNADIGSNGNGASGGGAGTWNTTLLNWDRGAVAHTNWNSSNPDFAVMAGTGATVTVGSGITASGIDFTGNSYVLDAVSNGLASGSGGNQLRLGGNNWAATINGAISGTGSMHIQSIHTGTLGFNPTPILNFGGTSTGGWTGQTTITRGVAVNLTEDNQVLNSISGITLNGGMINLTNTSATAITNNRINDSAAITINGGGGFRIANSNIADQTYSEDVGDVTLNSGYLKFSYTTNLNTSGTTQTLTLNSFTRNNHGVVSFGPSANSAGAIKVTGATQTAANEIIGPWAISGNGNTDDDYAVYDATGKIVNRNVSQNNVETSWSTAWSATANTHSRPGAAVLSANREFNTLRLSAANTLSVGEFKLATFGLFSSAGASSLEVGTNGFLTIPTNNGNSALYLMNGNGAYTVNAPIRDNGAAKLTLVLSGGNGYAMTLNGDSDYTGGTVIARSEVRNSATSGAANLEIGHVNAFGASTNYLKFDSGILDLNAINVTVGEFSGEVSSYITASAGGTLTVGTGTASTSDTEFKGLITAGQIVKNGDGKLTLSGINTANAATAQYTVNGGTLQFAKVSSFFGNGADTANTANWTKAKTIVKSGATLAFNVGGTNEFTAANINSVMTGLGGSNASGTEGFQAGSRLGLDTTNATGSTFTQGNAIADSSGAGGGAIGLTKLGTGTLVLDKANTYSGPTAVNAGTLRLGVDDCLANTSDVLINAATLAASASVNDEVGTLDVAAASSTINLGTGASLVFADSHEVDWTGGNLNITGTFLSGSSLKFGTTDAGLTDTQLGQIFAAGWTDFDLDASGYLIATPSFVGPVSAANSTVTATPASVSANGIATSTITITLRDSNGALIAGEGVTLAGSPLGATITPAGVQSTNGSGQAVFTVKSTLIGPVVFTATSVTDNVTITQTANVDFLGSVNAANSTVSASPSSVIANGIATSTITVTLRDGNGSLITGEGVTLAANPPGATITPAGAQITNGSGQAAFTVKSGTIGPVVFTATSITDNVTITQTANVTFADPLLAQAFNVKFLTDGQANATGLVGVVGSPGEFWNQGTTSVSNLADATGTVVPSLNVTGLTGGGSTVSTGLSIFNSNRAFFGKGQDTTVSITGLTPDTAYDLYIYALSHNTGSWGNNTDTERAAGDFVTTNTVLGNGQSQWLDNGKAGTNGNAFVPNGNYVVFQSIVSNGSGNISILVDAYDGLDGVAGNGDGDCRLHVCGLQIRAASGMSVDYAAWRNAYYPGLGLPNADDDGDGLSNDFEHIFGLNPTNGASASPYPTPFGTDGYFSYSRRSQSLINMNYRVWYSTNLVDWFVDNAANQLPVSSANGVEIMGVDINPALLSEPKLFVQVSATPITQLDVEPSLMNVWGSGNTITLLFSEPMNPSSATNPDNYAVTQDVVGALSITNATLNPGGGSVTLTLGSSLGLNTGYTVSVDRVTSSTGQSLGSGVSRQFKTWDNDPNGIKVFILAGQSNMVGYGSVETGNGSVAGAIGSLRYLAVNDASYPEYNYASLLTNPGDTASAFRNRSDVKVWWRNGASGNVGGAISKGDLGPPYQGAASDKIGPEFAFGHVLGDFYTGVNEDVLIIKCAWGGRDLAEKFRPPSAVAKRGGVVGPFYNAIIDQTREVLNNLGTQFPTWSGRGYEIVGFAWHQGYNDRISTAFSAEYKDNLPDLITDVRNVFNKPNLPFVIASTGMDIGAAEAPPYTGYSAVEKAQLWAAGVAQPANVLGTDARPFWRQSTVSPSNQGYHWNWNAESYFLIGKSLGDNMVDLLTP